MPEAELFIDFDPELDARALAEKLRIGPDDREEFDALLETARAVMRPKAILRAVALTAMDADSVTLSGVRVGSAVAAKQFHESGAREAIAYVATGGMELHALARAQSDPLAEYWADGIAEAAMRAAAKLVFAEMNERLGEGVTINPGSTHGWTVKGQADLFSMIGGVTEKTGVSLTESFLMVPYKSVSGIYFPSDSGYVNCMFCAIEKCPNRRAPFDPSAGMTSYA